MVYSKYSLTGILLIWIFIEIYKIINIQNYKQLKNVYSKRRQQWRNLFQEYLLKKAAVD